ncbi:MAG: hypothetical protein MUE65_07010, partial [Methanomassiliicoccales archaeon]|nr:hypothetical protein [Methanomassiliicoccales archaeon]
YLEPPASTQDIERPRNLERMLDISRRLSSPFPFVRVDFYDLGDRVYVGELTFYPHGGMERFNKQEYDLMLGEMLVLPERRA